MSKEVQPNLLVHKGLAVTALGQFIQCLLTESLKEMGQNIDKVINVHVDKLAAKGMQAGKVNLAKIDFNSLAIEVKKEVIKTFEQMKTEFTSTEINETQH